MYLTGMSKSTYQLKTRSAFVREREVCQDQFQQSWIFTTKTLIFVSLICQK
jgi:hypothetical protein